MPETLPIPEELKRGATRLSDLTHAEAFDLVDQIRAADVIMILQDGAGSVIKGAGLIQAITTEKQTRGVVMVAFHADNDTQVNTLFTLLKTLATTDPDQDHISALAFADMLTQARGRAH